MKRLFMLALFFWLQLQRNKLQARIAKEQAKIDYWDKQNKFLRKRIAALEAAERN